MHKGSKSPFQNRSQSLYTEPSDWRRARGEGIAARDDVGAFGTCSDTSMPLGGLSLAGPGAVDALELEALLVSDGLNLGWGYISRGG